MTTWPKLSSKSSLNVVEAKKKKDKSVEAGREFVEAYVIYMHYVEGIHAAIMSAGAHHAEAGAGRFPASPSIS